MILQRMLLRILIKYDYTSSFLLVDSSCVVGSECEYRKMGNGFLPIGQSV